MVEFYKIVREKNPRNGPIKYGSLPPLLGLVRSVRILFRIPKFKSKKMT
jgi:hypothetical protein